MRFKAIFGAVLIFLSLLASRSFGIDTPSENLLKNGDFEKWSEAKTSNPLETVAAGFDLRIKGRKGTGRGRAYKSGNGQVDTEKHSGNFAQYIQTTTWGQGIVSSGAKVKMGHRYKLSVWAKVLSGKFKFSACFAHKPWTYLGKWIVGPNGQWTHYSKEFVAPANCKSIAIILFLDSGSAYIDDLELIDLGLNAEKETVDKLPLSKGALSPGIAKKRIAVFNEKDFPSESPRDAKWYMDTLHGLVLKPQMLSCSELSNEQIFNKNKFDTLILPTGGFFPDDAGVQIEKFLDDGGTVLIDGAMTNHTIPLPKEINDELKKLEKDYRTGKNIYQYIDFIAKHPLGNENNVFYFDKLNQKWLPKMLSGGSYEKPMHKKYFKGFLLETWPNRLTAATHYARLFNEPLKRNPALKSIMPDFPENIEPDNKSIRKEKLIRLKKIGNKKGAAEETWCDLLLPLYVFENPSGKKYSAFPNAGRELKDKDSDFYIIRYHNLRRNGGTFIHLGNSGAKLLRSDAGKDALRGILRLAEADLPGECPAEFVNTVNQLRVAFSEYSRASIGYRDMLAELARIDLYHKKTGELKDIKKKLSEEIESFKKVSLKYDKLQTLIAKRDGGFAYGNEKRKKLLKQLKTRMDKINKESLLMKQKLSLLKRPEGNIPVNYPYLDHIYFGLDNIRGRGPFAMKSFKELLARDGLRFEGYKVTTYRFDFPIRGGPFKTKYKSGILDVEAGNVKPAKGTWFANGEAMKNWRESYRWKLQRVAKSPDITSIFGLGERNFAWSMWGKRAQKLFVKYLKNTHGSIKKLNAVYKSDYKDFESVQLPTKKPRSQTDHALWEDWTRFREVYRLEQEIKPLLKTLDLYAPDKLFISHCTYNQHGKTPANGINFYEYGKAMKVNGFEHSNKESKEFLTFDIIGANSKNLNSEWGAFYFPPGTQQGRVDLLEECLWKGISNGQIGWSLFYFSTPGCAPSNFYDLMNQILPTGARLSITNKKFKFIKHIILDGKREEPAIRIVYSPTTRRHTSWPKIEGDVSFKAVEGLYRMFKQAHINARAIDEQAVWEGKLPTQCKLLIIPAMSYQNDKFYLSALKYLQAGGNVLVTSGSGEWNQYGQLKRSWLTLAGVAPVKKLADNIIVLKNGGRYFSSTNSDAMCGFQILFPAETKVLETYRGGVPALIGTKVGKGTLFVSGVPLGKDCSLQWLGKPDIPLAFLEPVFKSVGIKRKTILSDPFIMVRPWSYKGQKYLFLSDSARNGLTDFSLSIEGAWKVKDYLLGENIPAKYDGEYTSLEGIIPSPGGLVLSLHKDASPVIAAGKRPSLLKKAPIEKNMPQKSNKKIIFDLEHPFNGRIWGGSAATDIGDYKVDIDVETKGGWGGKTYMTISHKGEEFRKLCEAGKEMRFYFSDYLLKVKCDEVVSVYPVNVKCDMSLEKLQANSVGCSLKRDDYYGWDSVVLSNGLLKVRILPRLGGRIIEFISLPDGTNHCFTNKAALKEGLGTAWSDFGGIEENAGGFPGPYWNADFNVNILRETSEEVTVKLTMEKSVKWNYGYAKPKGGLNRLEKVVTLKRGVAGLDISLKAFNEMSQKAPVGLRIHPEWKVGGDVVNDLWFYGNDGQINSLKYPFNMSVKAKDSSWSAIVDPMKRMALIFNFDQKMTNLLYSCSSSSSYNLEFFSEIKEIPSFKSLDFNYHIGFMRGLSGVYAYKNALAANIVIKDRKVIDLQLASSNTMTGQLQLQVLNREGKVFLNKSYDIALVPNRSITIQLPLDNIGDGFVLSGNIKDGQGQTLLTFKRAIPVLKKSREDASVEEYKEKIKKLQGLYQQQRGKGVSEDKLRVLKSRITQAYLLVSDINSTANPSERKELMIKLDEIIEAVTSDRIFK